MTIETLSGTNGDFELILSVERPAGYTGNWTPLHTEATGMTVRLCSYDWGNEIDPTLCIECLDTVPTKPRLTPTEIIDRISEMAKLPARKTRIAEGTDQSRHDVRHVT